MNSDAAHRAKRLQDSFVDYFVIRGQTPDIDKDKAAKDKLHEAGEKLKALEATLPPYAQAPIMAEMANAPETHLATGGDFRVPGDKVEPGTLAVLPPLTIGNTPPRLALRRGIGSRQNPPTPPRLVNPLWPEL